MTITATFFGTLNALGIGILGEYVTRIYDQVRARPMFIVGSKTNFDSPEIEAPLLVQSKKAHGSEKNVTIEADQEFSQQS